jgi:hypothetical protein
MQFKAARSEAPHAVKIGGVLHSLTHSPCVGWSEPSTRSWSGSSSRNSCTEAAASPQKPVQAARAKLFLLPPGEARYDVSPSNSLLALSRRRGESPAAAFLSYLLETEGLGLLYYPVLNADLAAVAEMIASPDVVIGLGDADAHVALTMDAGQPTYVLSHWVRDEGLLPLEKAVAKLTSEGAALLPSRTAGFSVPGRTRT